MTDFDAPALAIRSCSSCRHATPANPKIFERGEVDGNMMNVLDHPGLAALRDRPIFECRAHAKIVLGEDFCQHFGPLGSDKAGDGDLYFILAAERATTRKRALQAHAEATAKAEALVGKVPCELCGFIHNRCVDCAMPWSGCAKCSKCKLYYRGRKLDDGRLQCPFCDNVNEAPTAPLEWPGGRCDGCAETFRRKRPWWEKLLGK